MNENGIIVTHRFESSLLRSNALKDPYVRDVIVYLPPNYRKSKSKEYLTVILLPSFGSNARALLNIDPLGENIEQRLNRLMKRKYIGPMIVVIPDCFTKFGGNQYIDSTATGMYESYIIKEIVPFIQREYNCSHLGILGKSSGGYGALYLAMKYHTIFDGFAAHAPDSGFEYCYLPEFPKVVQVLSKNKGVKKWLFKFWKKNDCCTPEDRTTLNIVAMGAHYSPNPENKETGFDLPFDSYSGEICSSVWKRWLSRDPIRMVTRYRMSFERLRCAYIDCGNKDEFNINLGTRILHSKLCGMGIKHFYEEFEGGHTNISYRLDKSLSKLYSDLSS
ncbi:MAG: esterase family protein [Thermoproteota archaeon]|nr:esterase family protein [Thermoproteota archaeon]